ncbi:helix-turn-helix domain-containing protein [Stutzerimonas frequens]
MAEKTMQRHSTSVEAQRARLLARLRIGALDTFTARRELHVMHPGGRIKELRAAGHPIRTERVTLTDEDGITHSGVALYFLSSTSAEVAE